MYEEVTDPDKTCAGLFQAGWLRWHDLLSCSYGISRHRADFYLLLDLSCVYFGKGFSFAARRVRAVKQRSLPCLTKARRSTISPRCRRNQVQTFLFSKRSFKWAVALLFVLFALKTDLTSSKWELCILYCKAIRFWTACTIFWKLLHYLEKRAIFVTP